MFELIQEVATRLADTQLLTDVPAVTARRRLVGDFATIVSALLAAGIGGLIWKWKDAEIAATKAQLEGKDAIIEARDAQIEAKHAQLLAKEEILRVKDSAINQLQDQVKFHESMSLPKIQERVEAMRKFIEVELEQVKEESARLLREKEEEIRRLQAHGAARTQELDRLREEKRDLETRVESSTQSLSALKDDPSLFLNYYEDFWKSLPAQRLGQSSKDWIITLLTKEGIETSKTVPYFVLPEASPTDLGIHPPAQPNTPDLPTTPDPEKN